MAQNTSSPNTSSADTSEHPGQGLTIDQALGSAYGHWAAGQATQAEVLCQRILEVWPDNPGALHLLGLMSHSWGNLDLAIDYLRKACLSPRAPAVYSSNLAEMYRQKGLLAEGEQAARRAVAMDASLVGGWNNLGIILQELGQYEEALLCLQRVVALNPNHPEAHNNLGNTFKQMGQLDRARASYLKALTLSPNYAEAHSNLANLLKEFFLHEEALAEAKSAIEINPRFVDAYINASAVEMSRQRYEEALKWLNALLAFAPSHIPALTAKARALGRIERRAEALEVAKHAVIIGPDNNEAHNALGLAYQGLGLYDDAIAAFDKAALSPAQNPEQAPLNKGLLLMEINRPDEARTELDKALRLNPKSAPIYFNLSDLKTFKQDDPELAAMEKLLANNEIQSLYDRMSLSFALAKAWMDVGDDSRAFGYLNIANKMKRSTLNYDAAATDEFITSIIDAFPKAIFASSPSLGARSELPIFVIGMPRSGTTLIEQILASHPEIKGAGELAILSNLSNRIQSGDGRRLVYPTDVAGSIKEVARTIGRDYLAEIEKLGRGHKRVVDKMPANFLYAGLIALTLPDARIIHCRRNPMDTCLSCYTKLFSGEQDFSYDQEELGLFYKSYERLMDHWRSILPPERFLEINYEDVVDNLEVEAKRLVEFSGLAWDSACLDFYKGNRPVRTASINQVRQPVHKRSVGRWKRFDAFLGPLKSSLGVKAV